MPSSRNLNRRDFLVTSAGAALLAGSGGPSLLAADPPKPKTVAAVMTAYQKKWHADVLLGKILEGWKQDGGPGPALKIVSMYVDQFREGDLARGLAKKFDIPIFDTIEKAVTVGGDRIPVDGVISVGEHGDYPYNELQQHLYPRRRLFEGITDTFKKYGRVVPVFNDKHLGPVWTDAKWMYDRAKELNVPFMAGSSLPVGYRKPDVAIPMDCEIEAAVGIGYSGLDIYGFHTLDCYQSFVERRRGAETGVKSVQCLQGDAMWKVVDSDRVPKAVLEAALAVLPGKNADIREGKDSALFLFEYNDGLQGTVLMLPNGVGGISTAVKLKGESQIRATHYEERPEPVHPHFAFLLKGIERMIHTGKPSYPVERTLLSGGILDRALNSRARNYEKLMTPELAIRYKAVDYPHAPEPDLASDPAKS